MANRIKELRDQKGWSMERLGDLAETTKQQIDKLEKGQRRLTLEWMKRLAKAFGVRPAELISEDLGADHAVLLQSRHAEARDPALSGKHGETIEQIRGSINQALVPLDPEMFPIALAAAKRLVDVLERATAPEASSKSDPSSTSAP